MGTTAGAAQPNGVLITLIEAELAIFWSDLWNCDRSIDPIQIRYALEANNSHSGNKVEMFSQGLPN